VFRRQLVTFVTMLALTGILVSGAVWGWRSLFAKVPTPDLSVTEPTPTCTPERVERGGKLRSKQVRVSVFNGGSRSGLAGRTLDALMARGFVGGDLGNAPSDLNVIRVQVWSTEKRDPAARLVARQFGRQVKVRLTKKDLGAGVDVIVGNAFERLHEAPRKVTVGKPQEYCVPVEQTQPPT
jgi:hypothetical protein